MQSEIGTSRTEVRELKPAQPTQNEALPPIEPQAKHGFAHPPLFIELLKLYKEYYAVYAHQPKLFRISISERIMEELAEAMKLVVMANFHRANSTEIEESEKFLLALRGKTELLKAYFLIGWEMKFISHGFYGIVSERLEEVGRQTYNWSQWLKKQKKPMGA